MKRNNTDILIALFLVIFAASARIINADLHLPNFAPLAAIGLFSGAMFKEKRAMAFLIPMLGQLVGDLYFQFFTAIPGFYGVSAMVFNYGALVSAAALGVMMKQPRPATTLAYLFGASTAFFLVSNFGYFTQGWNGYSFAGLIKTYVDGIPFFKYTLAGDMVGGIALFGGYFMLQQASLKNAQKVKA